MEGTEFVVDAEILISQESVDKIELVTRSYRQRHAILTLMRQLNRLISAIQRHRGVSLAHLAGDGLFMDDVTQVQAQVNQRLAVLKSSVDAFDVLVSPHQQQNIQHGWNTVCHDWQGDALLENFEYHSFLIDQLLQLNGNFGRQLEPSLLAASELESDQFAYADDSVLRLVCRQVPELIENLARIRGLATHAAVVHQCDEDHQKKLLYWLQCAQRQNKELIVAVDALDAGLKSGWRSLSELKNYELKLAFFLNTVSKDIVQGDCSQADARQLFALGSEIIDAYVEGVDGGVSLLLTRLEAELEGWLTSV